MMKKLSSENGMVIVEATVVFPVIFLVIFLMIFAGNAYFQKCRVEAIVNEMAIAGAAYCADPMLDDVESGDIPAVKDVDVQPYRYLIGGMKEIQDDIEKKVNERFGSLSTGLFSNMRPSSETIKVEYNNGFIYSTFSVDIDYKITMPVRLLGMSDYISLNVSSRANMPVSDSPEFIRNVDMVEDYMQKFRVTEEIQKMIDKVNEWLG